MSEPARVGNFTTSQECKKEKGMALETNGNDPIPLPFRILVSKETSSHGEKGTSSREGNKAIRN